MRQAVILCGTASFILAFLGSTLASVVAGPRSVDAQEARLRAEQVTVLGSSGMDRVDLRVAPSGRAFADVLAADGTRRLSAATGGGPGPDEAYYHVYNAEGTFAATLGIGRGPTADGPLTTALTLWDLEQRPRLDLRIAEDGTPSMVLLDAAGNVTWEAK